MGPYMLFKQLFYDQEEGSLFLDFFFFFSLNLISILGWTFCNRQNTIQKNQAHCGCFTQVLISFFVIFFFFFFFHLLFFFFFFFFFFFYLSALVVSGEGSPGIYQYIFDQVLSFETPLN